MAIKKSELYASLWASCDELRGGMDASRYMDYLFTLLFIKYMSDNCGVFAIPEGCSFQDMLALKHDNEIGGKLNKITRRLAKENDLQGVIDIVDFNSETLLGGGLSMVDRLSNLIGVFEELDLDFSVDGSTVGTVYRQLMQQVSNTSGKGMAVSYTPPEVCELMAKVLCISTKHVDAETTIYDPACGFGELLLQVAEEAGGNVSLYGQEVNSRASGHAQMNMILSGVNSATIANSNALSEPRFLDNGNLRQFDCVVACPPLNVKNWGVGFDPEHDAYSRFPFGIPPKQSGDYAFVQHMIASLKPGGKMAVLIAPGALFRGHAEAAIRQSLLEADLIEAVIGLPPNLLSHTGIPTCVLICSKHKPETRTNKVLFINANRCFAKTRTKNILRSEHIERIAQTFEDYSDIEKFSRVVGLDEIRNNAFNLNIQRYVDSSELAALLKQHCDQFDKYLMKNLAVEINSVGVGKEFEDKTNAFFVSRMLGSALTVDVNIPAGKHHHYFQVVLNEKAINHYVVQFLRSTIGQLALSALAQSSTTLRIDRASLSEVTIALPALAHQQASIETHRKLSTLREYIERINQDLSLNPTTSSEFEAQLDAMLETAGELSVADQIRSIIRQGESKTVEFKETYDLCVHRRKRVKDVETAALKTIVAFLNSEGGTLLIGVSDRPQIVGIAEELEKFYKNMDDNFLKHIKNKLKARVGEQFYPFIDYDIIEVDGKRIIRFECRAADHPCFLDDNDFYVRTNPASDKLTAPKFLEYVTSHFSKQPHSEIYAGELYGN